MESRKRVLMKPFAGKEWRCREWTCGHSRGKERVGWAVKVALTYTHCVCAGQAASVVSDSSRPYGL